MFLLVVLIQPFKRHNAVEKVVVQQRWFKTVFPVGCFKADCKEALGVKIKWESKQTCVCLKKMKGEKDARQMNDRGREEEQRVQSWDGPLCIAGEMRSHVACRDLQEENSHDVTPHVVGQGRLCTREGQQRERERKFWDVSSRGMFLMKKSFANLSDHSKWWEVRTIGTEGRNSHFYSAPTEQM